MILEGRLSNRGLFDFLAAGATAKVMAAFSGGIYLDFTGKTVMLHDLENGFIPFGIALEKFAGRGKAFGLEQGMELYAKGNTLECEDADLLIRLCCEDMPCVRTESRCLAGFARRVSKCSELCARSALSVYSACDLNSLSKDSIDDIFARTAYTGISQLCEAMETRRPEMMEAALERLIGLGRGLTPSLDDFICGILFVMHYSRRMWGANLPWLEELSSAVTRIAPVKTNPFSAAYLVAAAAGEDFSVLRMCIESACDESFASKLSRLFKIGSSSGADMLCGMSFAANYIMQQRQVTL